MTDLPISFTVELIRQLRGGGISQLRRPHGLLARVVPGDRLWVREPFHLDERHEGTAPTSVLRIDPVPRIFYAAEAGDPPPGFGRRRFARIMPRAFHRMHLRIVAARDQRLQDLTDADARAEGAASRHAFADRWDRINAPQMRSITGDAIRWPDNPRVTVITFDRIDTPIPGDR